jgi:hypothetical protein
MVIQATGTSINLLVSMLSSQVGVAALFVGRQDAWAGRPTATWWSRSCSTKEKMGGPGGPPIVSLQ